MGIDTAPAPERPADVAAGGPAPVVGVAWASRTDPFGAAVGGQVVVQALEDRLGRSVALRVLDVDGLPARWAAGLPAERLAPGAPGDLACLVVGPGTTLDGPARDVPPGADPPPPTLPVPEVPHLAVLAGGPRAAVHERRRAWMRTVGWIPDRPAVVVDAALGSGAWTAAVGALAASLDAPVLVVDLRPPEGRPGGPAAEHGPSGTWTRLSPHASLDDVVAVLVGAAAVVVDSAGAHALCLAAGVPTLRGGAEPPADLAAALPPRPDAAARAAEQAEAVAALDELADAVAVATRDAGGPPVPSTAEGLRAALDSLRVAWEHRGHRILAERMLLADRVGEVTARLDDVRRWHEVELRHRDRLVEELRQQVTSDAQRQIVRLRRQVDHERRLRELQAQHVEVLAAELASVRSELAVAQVPAPVPGPRRVARGVARRSARVVRRLPGGGSAVGAARRAVSAVRRRRPGR